MAQPTPDDLVPWDQQPDADAERPRARQLRETGTATSEFFAPDELVPYEPPPPPDELPPGLLDRASEVLSGATQFARTTVTDLGAGAERMAHGAATIGPTLEGVQADAEQYADDLIGERSAKRDYDINPEGRSASDWLTAKQILGEPMSAGELAAEAILPQAAQIMLRANPELRADFHAGPGALLDRARLHGKEAVGALTPSQDVPDTVKSGYYSSAAEAYKLAIGVGQTAKFTGRDLALGALGAAGVPMELAPREVREFYSDSGMDPPTLKGHTAMSAADYLAAKVAEKDGVPLSEGFNAITAWAMEGEHEMRAQAQKYAPEDPSLVDHLLMAAGATPIGVASYGAAYSASPWLGIPIMHMAGEAFDPDTGEFKGPGQLANSAAFGLAEVLGLKYAHMPVRVKGKPGAPISTRVAAEGDVAGRATKDLATVTHEAPSLGRKVARAVPVGAGLTALRTDDPDQIVAAGLTFGALVAAGHMVRGRTVKGGEPPVEKMGEGRWVKSGEGEWTWYKFEDEFADFVRYAAERNPPTEKAPRIEGGPEGPKQLQPGEPVPPKPTPAQEAATMRARAEEIQSAKPETIVLPDEIPPLRIFKKQPPVTPERRAQVLASREATIAAGFPHQARTADGEIVTVLGVLGEQGGRRDSPLGEPTLEVLNKRGGQVRVRNENGDTFITFAEMLHDEVPMPAPAKAPKSRPERGYAAPGNKRYKPGVSISHVNPSQGGWMQDRGGKGLKTGQLSQFTTYRGSGRATQGEAYNPEYASLGPLLGDDVGYSAFAPEVAENFGPNVKIGITVSENPLVIDSDKTLRGLTGLDDLYLSPENAPQLVERLRELPQQARDAGHDSILINFDHLSDMNDLGDSFKRLRELFGQPQLIELDPEPTAKTEEQVQWRTGINLREQSPYVTMIRGADDPERLPREARKGQETEWQNLRKLPVQDLQLRIAHLMDDGRPRTMNAIAVEVLDQTADMVGDNFLEALYRLAEDQELEHTTEAPIYFRQRGSTQPAPEQPAKSTEAPEDLEPVEPEAEPDPEPTPTPEPEATPKPAPTPTGETPDHLKDETAPPTAVWISRQTPGHFRLPLTTTSDSLAEEVVTLLARVLTEPEENILLAHRNDAAKTAEKFWGEVGEDFLQLAIDAKHFNKLRNQARSEAAARGFNPVTLETKKPTKLKNDPIAVMGISTSTDDNRWNLGQVRVEKGLVQATDGHRAIQLKGKNTSGLEKGSWRRDPGKRGQWIKSKLDEEESYPKIDQVFPKTFEHLHHLEKSQLHSLISTLKGAKARYGGGKNRLSLELPATDTDAVVNGQYLLDALQQLDFFAGQRLKIEYGDASSPIVLSGDGGAWGDVRIAVMPMRDARPQLRIPWSQILPNEEIPTRFMPATLRAYKETFGGPGKREELLDQLMKKPGAKEVVGEELNMDIARNPRLSSKRGGPSLEEIHEIQARFRAMSAETLLREAATNAYSWNYANAEVGKRDVKSRLSKNRKAMAESAALVRRMKEIREEKGFGRDPDFFLVDEDSVEKFNEENPRHHLDSQSGAYENGSGFVQAEVDGAPAVDAVAGPMHVPLIRQVAIPIADWNVFTWERVIDPGKILQTFMRDLGHTLYQGGKLKPSNVLGRTNWYTRNVTNRAWHDLEVAAHEIAHLLHLGLVLKKGARLGRQKGLGNIPDGYDFMFPEIEIRITSDPIIRDELLGVTYVLDPNRPKLSLIEGWAEFMRIYMTQPGKLDRVSHTVAWLENDFLPRNPELQEAIAKARKGMLEWVNLPAIERFRGKEQPLGDTRRIREPGKRKKELYQSLRQGLMNDLAQLQRFEESVKGKPIQQMTVLESATKDAQMSRHAWQVFESVMQFGFPREKADGSFEMIQVDAERGVGGFLDIIGPFQATGELDDFMDFLKAWRLNVLRNRAALGGGSLERAYTKEEIDAGLAKGKDEKGKWKPDWIAAKDDYKVWNDGIVDFSVASGITAPKSAARMKDYFHVPLFRQPDPGKPKAQGPARKTTGMKQPFKRYTGGTANTKPILDNIFLNTEHILKASILNRSLSKIEQVALMPGGGAWIKEEPTNSKRVALLTGEIARAFEERYIENLAQQMIDEGMDPAEAVMRAEEAAANVTDALKSIGPQLWVWQHQLAPNDVDIMAVFHGGKPTFYRVIEPDLFRSIVALDRHWGKGNVLTELAIKHKRMIQWVGTHNPLFWFRNLARDQQVAFLQSKYGYTMFMDAWRGSKSFVTKDATYQEMMANSGGLGSIYTSDDMRLDILKWYGKQGLDPETILASPKKIVQFIDQIGEIMEMGTRIGAYKKARDAGAHPRDAAYEANEISTDFTNSGDWKLVQYFNHIVPFQKAMLAATDRTMQSLVDTGTGAPGGPGGPPPPPGTPPPSPGADGERPRPKRFGMDDSTRKRMFMKFGALAVMSQAYAVWRHGFPLYETEDEIAKRTLTLFYVPRKAYIEELIAAATGGPQVRPSELVSQDYYSGDKKLQQAAWDELNRRYLRAAFPRAHLHGAILQAAEEAAVAFVYHDRTAEDAARVARSLLGQFDLNFFPNMPIPVPSLLQFPVEVALDESLFKDIPLKGDRLEPRSPELQYRGSTPLSARTIGEATGTSPVLIKQFLESQFGFYGSLGMVAADLLAYEHAPNGQLSRFFVEKAFSRTRAAGSAHSQRVFEIYRELAQANADINAIKKSGLPMDKRKRKVEDLLKKHPQLRTSMPGKTTRSLEKTDIGRAHNAMVGFRQDAERLTEMESLSEVQKFAEVFAARHSRQPSLEALETQGEWDSIGAVKRWLQDEMHIAREQTAQRALAIDAKSKGKAKEAMQWRSPDR